MLMELTVIPLAHGRSLSADDESGLPYRVTAFGTLIEGEWDGLMDIAKRCHQTIRKKTERVLISFAWTITVTGRSAEYHSRPT